MQSIIDEHRRRVQAIQAAGGEPDTPERISAMRALMTEDRRYMAALAGQSKRGGAHVA